MSRRNEALRHPQESFYINVQDWQIAFCKGDRAMATMMAYFENSHCNYLKMVDKAIENEKMTGVSVEISPYREHDYKTMREHILGFYGRNTIINAVSSLVEAGVINTYTDENNHKFYRFVPEPVQSFIDGEWIPFLGTINRKKQNPLETYLAQIGHKRKRKKAPLPKINEGGLNSNDPETRLKINDPRLKINGLHPETRLKINDPRLKINDNNNKDYNNKEDNKKDTQFSANADFQEKLNLFADLQTETEGSAPARPTPTQTERPKKKRGKWDAGVFDTAKKAFEKSYVIWQRRKNGVSISDATGFYWSGKEIGQLSNLLTAIIAQESRRQGRDVPQWEAVNDGVAVFFEKAAKMDDWFMDSFTPSHLFSHFNKIASNLVKKQNKSGNYEQPYGQHINRAVLTKEKLAYLQSL